jgi:hypothetical protein
LVALLALGWWLAARPIGFDAWLERSGQAQAVAAYRQFLGAHGVADIVTMPALLSTARDAEDCGVEPWVVPPQAAWVNMVPTLRVVKELDSLGLLSPMEITSTYRNDSLNTCARGAARSKHRSNHAIDMRLIGAGRERRYGALCEFWRREGQRHSLGLGMYRDFQIHVDADGFRTWGSDHRAATSPCIAPAQ